MQDSHSIPIQESSDSLPPLIIVQGFLSPASDWIWGPSFQDLFSQGEQSFRNQSQSSNSPESSRRRKIIFAPLGPCSSLHDRACELFYALKGGRIDYGKEHSLKHGHSRWGRFYSQALFKNFGPQNPAHFLAHSLGGNTIMKLQQLLREGFFDHVLQSPSAAALPEESILSITAVSSPFHGTPLVYILGSRALPYPSVRFLSLGNLLAKVVHVIAFLDGFAPERMSKPLRNVLDVYADAWHFAQSESVDDDASREETQSSNRGIYNLIKGSGKLMKQLWRSDWAEKDDCAPWDCTLWERERDAEVNGWANLSRRSSTSEERRQVKTFYKSYASFMTVPASKSSQDEVKSNWHETSLIKTPSHLFLSPLAFTANLIGTYDYSTSTPTPSFLPSSSSNSDLQLKALSHASEALKRKDFKEKPRVWETDSAYHSSTNSPSFLSPPRSQSPPPQLRSRFGTSGLNTPDLEWMEKAIDSKTSTLKLPSLLESWFANDGVVPLASQYHPGCCSPLHCQHSSGLPVVEDLWGEATSSTLIQNLSDSIGDHLPIPSFISSILPTSVKPAKSPRKTTSNLPKKFSKMTAIPNQWQVHHLSETSHTSIAPVWTGTEKQKAFWVGLGEWIAAVDEASGRVDMGP